MAASTVPTLVNTTDATGWAISPWPDLPWAFGDCRLEVGFTGGGPGGTCDVFFAGVLAWYRPAQEILVVSREVDSTAVKTRIDRRGRKAGSGSPYAIKVSEPAVTRLVAKFHANVDGVPDDGSGTYTGAASSLIQLPCDIVQHVLGVWAGQPLSKIERTPGAYGNFVDVRQKFKTWRQSNMVLAFSTGQEGDVASLVEAIAEARDRKSVV